MNVKNKIKRAAKLKGDFILRSGNKSDTYFDKYLFESDPVLLKQIANELKNLIPEGTEALAGLEMGGIPIVTALSLETGIPAAYIRKKAKDYGTCKYSEGVALNGVDFVLIEDVVSSGGAIIDAVKMFRLDGLNPKRAICVIDRETGGREALRSIGIELISLFTYSEIENS